MNLESKIVEAVIARLFGGESVSSMIQAVREGHPFVGKFCIVRTINAGVHAGVITSVGESTVTLAPNSLRLYYWKANHPTGALHAVAKFGLSKESKVEAAGGVVQLNGVIELLEVAHDAVSKIAEGWGK
jgi:hypothetical protein